ncbi:hypothetical protein ACFB49_44750 [Sphingomonas sp. DBB INV C78]|uniref:hypothetical protein n=1 Tax=Sphingomonas sp. DBB INV C78 TaxID=3349434 RepID=UPI0036D2DA4C
MARVLTIITAATALACCCLSVASPAEAKKEKAPKATELSTPIQPYTGPVLKAYKRDPLPIYDNEGLKTRDLMRASLPAIGSEGARVIGVKPGFVAIMLEGEQVWLRMSTVDYAGDIKQIKSAKCDQVALKFAKLEEDGLDQSLGLGCGK